MPTSTPKAYVDYEGKSPDEIYRDLVSRAGLFGQAFFGHAATKAQRRELTRLWARARRLAAPKPEVIVDTESPAVPEGEPLAATQRLLADSQPDLESEL